jgi:hypothetical protein
MSFTLLGLKVMLQCEGGVRDCPEYFSMQRFSLEIQTNLFPLVFRKAHLQEQKEPNSGQLDSGF